MHLRSYGRIEKKEVEACQRCGKTDHTSNRCRKRPKGKPPTLSSHKLEGVSVQGEMPNVTQLENGIKDVTSGDADLAQKEQQEMG